MLLGALQIGIPCYKCHCHILETRTHTLMCLWLLLRHFIGQSILSLSSLSLGFLTFLLLWVISKLQGLHLRYSGFSIYSSCSRADGVLSIKTSETEPFQAKI